MYNHCTPLQYQVIQSCSIHIQFNVVWSMCHSASIIYHLSSWWGECKLNLVPKLIKSPFSSAILRTSPARQSLQPSASAFWHRLPHQLPRSIAKSRLYTCPTFKQCLPMQSIALHTNYIYCISLYVLSCTVLHTSYRKSVLYQRRTSNAPMMDTKDLMSDMNWLRTRWVCSDWHVLTDKASDVFSCMEIAC